MIKNIWIKIEVEGEGEGEIKRWGDSINKVSNEISKEETKKILYSYF